MIESARITGYRGLRDVSMSGLGRVNLFVGKNNSGKTSVLEALYLMATRANPLAIWHVLSRRGEQIVETPNPGQTYQPEADICRLFHGHALDVGTRAVIQTRTGTQDRSLVFEVSETKREANPALFAQLQAHQMEEGNVGPRYMVSITGDPQPPATVIPLSGRGGLRQDVMQMLVNMNARAMQDGSGHRFVTTDSLSIREIQSELSKITLSPREEQVIRALQLIEPGIERIAVTNTAFFSGNGGPMRGGLKVRLSGQDEPVPIGSLGEGIWRLMTLAIVVSSMNDGSLFIDEIDVGLHHTVLKKMWAFIADVAKEFNVQVFATTHSADCVDSLATICRADTGTGSQVTIQRIETEEKRTIAYDEAEIVALARNHIEVR